MDPREALRMALESIGERKVRSALTTLGIAIGIAAIVALLGLGQGLKEEVVTLFSEAGANTITVLPISTRGEFGAMGGMAGGVTAGRIDLTTADVSKIEKIPGIGLATPVVTGTSSVEVGRDTKFASVLGVDLGDFARVYPAVECESDGLPRSIGGSYAVLGHYLAHQPEGGYFAETGQRIRLVVQSDDGPTKRTLMVAGVLNVTGITFPLQVDSSVLVPFTTSQKMFGTGRDVDAILVLVEEPERVQEVSTAIEEMYDDEVTAFSFQIIVDMVTEVLGTVNLVLAGIAGISLFVAGIGILNTMLMAVMERTREIGILKAVGAKRTDVALLFLSEASVVGVLGGIIGVFLGWGAAHVFELLGGGLMGMGGASPMGEVGLSVSISPTLVLASLAFAVSVSVLFALYPTFKAAGLQPVDALRQG